MVPNLPEADVTAVCERLRADGDASTPDGAPAAESPRVVVRRAAELREYAYHL